jgi:hypothetical protein
MLYYYQNRKRKMHYYNYWNCLRNENSCIFCDVATETLILLGLISLPPLSPLLPSHPFLQCRLLTAEPRIQSCVTSCEIIRGQCGFSTTVVDIVLLIIIHPLLYTRILLLADSCDGSNQEERCHFGRSFAWPRNLGGNIVRKTLGRLRWSSG